MSSASYTFFDISIESVMTAPPFADQAIKGLYAYKITHSPLIVQCAIFLIAYLTN